MHGVSQVDISKYRKYVLTTLLVLGSILLSYLPCGICLVSALFSKMEESELVRHIGRIGGMMQSFAINLWRDMMKTSDSLISLGNLTTHVPVSSCPIEIPGYFPPKNFALIIVIGKRVCASCWRDDGAAELLN
ncbi:hypothetical protein ACROYT_G043415 [Oculina patagonica]